MMAILLKNWQWLSGFLGLAIIFGWIAWQSHHITVLKQELETSQRNEAALQDSFAKLQETSTAQIQALETERTSEIHRSEALAHHLSQIKGSNDDQDGSVAPVLRDTIGRLYDKTDTHPAGD